MGVTPQADYDDPKELHAFFGLAFYMAQILEQGVLNLNVALRHGGVPPLTYGAIDKLFGQMGKCTFGGLLRAAESLAPIPDGLHLRLGQAVQKRNYLAHRFFVEHAVDLLANTGRRRMIDELREIHAFLEATVQELDPVWVGAWAKLGMTQEIMDGGLREMRAEGASQDTETAL